MVAYSFKARFAEPILAGTKDQTIRGPRKRHARPGEPLQLYVGMRTRQCRLITRATCLAVFGIHIDFRRGRIGLAGPDVEQLEDAIALDSLARRDGFADFGEMLAFWRETHGTVDQFSGVLIRWQPLEAAP